MLDVVVIVPTRHEAGNVTVLAETLTSLLGPAALEWQLLFVDDSDDETVPVLREIAATNPNVEVLHRECGSRSGGLSGAVLAGIETTLSRCVAVMDADLQHPPAVLLELLAPVLSGEYDIAVATRYVDGGNPGGLAGPTRRLVSTAARGLVRVMFPRVRGVSDPLGGFFACNRSVVDGVDLQPEGFKILLEVLARGRWGDITEVPYEFASRFDGTSKAGLREGMRFLRHAGRLWLAANELGLSGAVPARSSTPHPA